MEGEANLASRSAPELYHAKVAGSSPPPSVFTRRRGLTLPTLTCLLTIS